MVAVPLSPPVERDQEQTRRLEAAQPLLRPRLPDNGIAQRSTQLLEHRRTTQEPLITLGQPHHRLAIEVVGHVPVVTGDRQRLTTAVSRDHRRQVQTDGPALGAFSQRGGQLSSEADVGVGEDLLGTGRVERQMARPELQHVTRRPQPRQVRLLGTTRRDHLRTSRHPRDHHPQGVVTVRRLQLVQVVQHQHERLRARPERRGETRRRATQHRHTETTHIGHQLGVARRNACVRRRQQHEQSRRIIVETVERYPRDATILSERPLGQQRRLAVPRRRGDADHPAIARPRRLDQVDATDQTGTRLRHRDLGVEQHLVDRGRDPTPARAMSPSRSNPNSPWAYAPWTATGRPSHRWAPISRNLRDAAASSLRLDQTSRRPVARHHRLSRSLRPGQRPVEARSARIHSCRPTSRNGLASWRAVAAG